jgi:hypothetical protein
MQVIHSLLFFVFLLLYVYYVGYHLQHHPEQVWSSQRLFLVFIPLILFLFAIYQDQEGPIVLRDLVRPLTSWKVFIPLLLSLMLIFYASMASRGASITMNVFHDPVVDISKGKLHPNTPSRMVALLNWSLVLCGLGILLFGLTLLVTILKFQRNELGFVTHLLLYLPCLLSEWLQGSMGESTATPGSALSGLATAPKSSIVAAVFLLAFALGFWKSLDLQRTWEDTIAKAKQLSSTTASMAELVSPERKDTLTLIPSSQDQRLHEPITLSLASAILMRDSLVPLKPYNHIWSIRCRLFLNSQQSFFYRGELDPATSLFDRSRNLLSFGEEDPWKETRTDLFPVTNFLEVRVCDQGLFLLSQWFDETKPTFLPCSFQSWHDLVIQHSGRRIDVAIDGVLKGSYSTSTIHAPSAALLSPETVCFFLGQSQFHGVVSNLTIAFNQEYMSKNFDHDPLFDRR